MGGTAQTQSLMKASTMNMTGGPQFISAAPGGTKQKMQTTTQSYQQLPSEAKYGSKNQGGAPNLMGNAPMNLSSKQLQAAGVLAKNQAKGGAMAMSQS